MPEGLGGGNIDALNYEVAQEQAATLARMSRRLTDALATLARFDEAHGGERGEERELLVEKAGEALWYYVIQREVLGLGNSEGLMRELGIPREVRLRMGLPRRRATPDDPPAGRGSNPGPQRRIP
ncbi:MAG TPA: DUF6665 family protein [Longimicrobiaceae bacterium]|nr:DUF6665 family protein [Longimicrobiaceae bacterium]